MRVLRRICLLLGALVSGTAFLHSQGIITTIAGGSFIFSQDGRPAVGARTGEIWGLTLDSAGNFYFSDVTRHLVHRVAPNGILTVVAGNSVPGFSGDGGRATSAALNSPRGVAVDEAGNVYIADQLNSRIRKVTPDGIITTFAGTGTPGFSGDGGPATLAAIAFPWGVATDSAGAVYISDIANRRIRRVGGDGIITTIAGNGTEGVTGEGGPATSASVTPNSLAVAADGSVYFAEAQLNRVRKVDPLGIITTVAGSGVQGFGGDNGPATAARFNIPVGLAVDAANNLYIGDQNNNRIRRVSAQGVITTVAGSGLLGFSGDGGPALQAAFVSPGAVAVATSDSSGEFYLADSRNNRVRRVTSSGTISTVAGGGQRFQGDGSPATSAALNLPRGVATDANGLVWIADSRNQRVRRVAANGVISTVAGNGGQGLSGDGGPAAGAALNNLGDVVVDQAGNTYVADTYNHRVRRIAPDGTIVTVAGSSLGFSGDGGPATSARLAYPESIALDSNLVLYITDTGNGRIRRVGADGIIRTIAGGGTGGDGGPATSAVLNSPNGVHVLPSGDILIADTFNERVRRVDTSGRISTFAGTGTRGFSGDGGPATSARMSQPLGVTSDALGNVYIADWGNSRVRGVGTDGRIRTVAGSGTGFGGDGGSPTSARLRNPTKVKVDAASNLYIADQGNDRIRKVLISSSPTFTATPATLSFSGVAGSSATRPLQMNLASSVPGVSWTGVIRNGAWLRLSASSGQMPAALSVTADSTSLAAGTYSASIDITAPAAAPSLQTVTVTFTVTAAPVARLAVQPATLSFRLVGGDPAPPAQSLRIENAGGGSLNWTARASVAVGNWLVISSESGTATPNEPASVEVSVRPAGLEAGAHSGTITVSAGSAGTVSVAVSIVVSSSAGVLLLSQSSMIFRSVEGGGPEAAQTLGVLNLGGGSIGWSAETTQPWLRLSTTAGRSEAGSAQVPIVTINADPAGLPAGFHEGFVRIRSGETNNSPQLLKVNLQVFPRGTRLGATVRPTGLIFVGVEGGGSPSSQEVTVSTPEADAIEFVSQPIDGPWVQREPDVSSASAENPGRIIVQPGIENLTSNVYRAGLTVFTRSDGVQHPVNLLFLVLPRGSVVGSVAPAPRAGAAGRAAARGSAAVECSEQLYLQFATVTASFTASISYPTTVVVNMRNGCGAPATGGAVQLGFSNGDAAVPLNDLANGQYIGEWRPVRESQFVVLTARGRWRNLEAQATVTAQLGSNPSPGAPALNQGGVLRGAGFGRGPVAPGSIISLFGQSFASREFGAASLPLPRSLGGVRVLIGEVEAPLFYVGPGQVNAQVPAELPSERPLQVRVETAGRSTAPEPLQTAGFGPAIFTLGGAFGDQGAILIGNTNRLAMPVTQGIPSEPARAGTVISIYCTGLGATQPAVASGQPGPSSEPLARVSALPGVTIGERPAQLLFAGLAPGFVGVYQVDVQVPAGVTPGRAVPVVITQGGTSSNTATIAIE